MKTFKQYLVELHGEQRTSELIFRSTNYPLSPSMFKRIFGEEKFTAFHITGMAGIETLIKMQNKKKAVSTLTNFDDVNLLLKGIGGSGGTLVMLEGIKLVSSTFDLHTQIDSDGYRWFNPLHINTDSGYKEILYPMIWKARANVWKKFEKQLDPVIDVSEIFDAGFEEKWEEITYIHDTKLKGQVVKAFFDEIEKLSMKEKEVLEDLFSDTPDPDIKPTSSIQLASDETVMTNFTIRRIWLIEGRYQVGSNIRNRKLKEFTEKWGKKFKIEILKFNKGDMGRLKGYVKTVARNRQKV